MKCPNPIELERSLDGGDDDLHAHVRGCDRCAAERDSIELLRAMAGTFAQHDVPAARAEAVRTAVLAGIEAPGRSTPSSRRRWPVAAVLAAAVAFAAWLGAPSTPLAVEVAARRGAVSGAADWRTASLQPDEVIELSDGALEVAVDALGRGERFRVVVGGDEVEVRGTRFSIAARRGELVAIAVIEGVVVVRAGGVERALGPGETWTRPLPGTARAVDPDTPAPPERDVAPATPRPRRPSPAIQTADEPPPAPRAPMIYERAWSELRESRFRAAAALFEEAASRGEPGLRRDAAYWAGVAHFRAGDMGRAKSALGRFLDRYPGARRRAEVEVMLGWIDVEGKRWDAAERRFQAGVTSAQPSVKRSAAAGLRAVRRARGH